MSDGTGAGAGAAAGSVTGAVAGAAAGGQQDQQPGAGQQQGGGDGGQQQERWQDKFLSAELRGNELVGRYGSVDDMAKGLIETQTWARGRVAVPKADDVAGFEEFAGKVRPAKADDYVIVGPDGAKTDTGEAFRQTFHELGLHPVQAQKLTEKFNQFSADALSQMTQKGKDEVHAIELELGPQGYNQRLAAVDSMLKGAGIEIDDIATALEQTQGAGKTLRALFALAEKTGELAKVDGATISMRMGTMTAAAAQAEVNRMSADPAMAKKIEDKSSMEYARRSELLRRIAKGD